MDHNQLEHSWKDINIMIATPCHDGKVTAGYFRSVMNLTHAIRDLGGSCQVVTPSGESLITRARNGLLGYFIAEQRFTHLLFIDSDIEFHTPLIVRLINSGHDLSAGCCPLKRINTDAQRESYQKFDDVRDVTANSLHYAFTGEPNDDGTIRMNIKDGFTRVLDVGTGLMLITRNCVDKLRDAYPELHCGTKTECCGYDNIHPEINDNFWLFFETSFDKEQKRYLSEDYHFCKLWRDIGGEVYMEVLSPITHTGIYNYEGDILRTIMPLKNSTPFGGEEQASENDNTCQSAQDKIQPEA